jgi:alkylation response protein AidB-like acyl-CoA dehydrogenase
MIEFEPTELTEDEIALQACVRAFLERELPRGTFEPALGMAAPIDQDFSKKLAAQGWIGMALPVEHGGHDRSPVERFVVAEELLRWGAPIGYHWFADRQIGPLIARVGTDEQRREFLPSICAAESSFCLGMSEPDAGSDLASVACRADAAPGGWRLNGTKVWTTGAHHHRWMVALVRTSSNAERHEGLSQVIVDLHAPGVTVNPIVFLDGTADFNEVVFEDVFVPARRTLGTVGHGWRQVNAELALERSGPERWLSTYLLVEQLLRERDLLGVGDAALEVVGAAIAQWRGLRQLSLSIARMVEQGREPGAEAALVKELGTRFEQDVVLAVRQLVDVEPSLASKSLFVRLLARAVLTGPSFTIRGGTIEILRSIVGKALQR